MADSQLIQMLKSGQNDLQWFDVNFNKLISQFNNQFIAFRNEEIIDSDNDLNKLMAKLKDKNVDTSNIFIKFVSRIKHIL